MSSIRTPLSIALPGRTGQGVASEFDLCQCGRIVMRNADLVRAIDLEGVVQAADRLGVTRQRLHQMITEGKIDYYPMGKRRMLHKRDVDALILRRQAKKAS